MYEKYGSPEDVLKLKEVVKPSPGDDEVLVKIFAASVNFNDMAFVNGKPILSRLWTGFLKPKYKILGADVAGRVEAIGKSVTRFKPGDELFGDLSACGLGGFAEFVCAVEDALVLKPITNQFQMNLVF